MDRTMSIGAAFALVIFPPGCGMTLLVSELAFATRAKSEAVEQEGSLFGLPFYLRSACRAQDTPALRTHALLPRIRRAPLVSGCLRAQTTIHVPVDQPSIQSGINAAKARHAGKAFAE